jgi:hypothetical protein
VKAKAFVAALLIGAASLAQAQAPAAPAAPPQFTFALHGFASGSICGQTGVAGPFVGCQASLFAAGDAATDGSTFTGDVRQTRLNFSVKGPAVLGGAIPQGVVEIDFFQGFGGGNFGNVSLMNRMRLAYAELNYGSTRFAFGQLNDLIVPMIPASLSHIAFPLGYGTGTIGWRRPGVWGFHTFGGDTKFEFAWMVGRSQWADIGAGGAAAANGIGQNNANYPGGYTLGEASALPAVEARFSLTSGKMLTAFVAGHWNQVDTNGYGTGGGKELDVMAGNAGFRLTPGPLTVAATGFTGKNLGPLIGTYFQFNTITGTGTATTAEDVGSWGYWAQVGFNLTKEFSLWAFYGHSQVSSMGDAAAAGFARTKNTTYNAIAQYRDGGFGFSVEWIRFITEAGVPTAATRSYAGLNDVTGTQFIATANYFF